MTAYFQLFIELHEMWHCNQIVVVNELQENRAIFQSISDLFHFAFFMYGDLDFWIQVMDNDDLGSGSRGEVVSMSWLPSPTLEAMKQVKTNQYSLCMLHSPIIIKCLTNCLDQACISTALLCQHHGFLGGKIGVRT